LKSLTVGKAIPIRRELKLIIKFIMMKDICVGKAIPIRRELKQTFYRFVPQAFQCRKGNPD
ncbi:MAG: hypothetical protein KA059_08120, partial [Elusimicrobiales bacterium]|nr:hypothetical protein [Elusimicrobiales bacterium]